MDYIQLYIKKIPLYISIRGEEDTYNTNQTQTMGDEGLEPPLKGL